MAESGPKFEEELAELEALVNRIDSGELSLEDAISTFERGVGLVRSLNQKLDAVERKVEVLTRGAQGQLRSSLYQSGGERSDQDDEPLDENDD